SAARPPGGLRRPAAVRMDEDPLGPVHAVDPAHLHRCQPGADRAVHLADPELTGQRANGARDSGILTDPVSFILGTRLELDHLASWVLGVLLITSRYSSGTIRALLLAVPRRYPMMLGKALVFAALVIIVGEIVAFCSFFIGAALVNGETFTQTAKIAGHAVTVHRTLSVSLSQPGALRAVACSGLYLTI